MRHPGITGYRYNDIDMKKIFAIAVFALLACAGASAQEAQDIQRAPAYRGLIKRVQPNGDTLRVYLRGDEWNHFTMTQDSWQIIEDHKGWAKYAKLNRKGEAVISRRKAHNAEDRKKCEIKWIERYGIKKD